MNVPLLKSWNRSTCARIYIDIRMRARTQHKKDSCEQIIYYIYIYVLITNTSVSGVCRIYQFFDGEERGRAVEWLLVRTNFYEGRRRFAPPSAPSTAPYVRTARMRVKYIFKDKTACTNTKHVCAALRSNLVRRWTSPRDCAFPSHSAVSFDSETVRTFIICINCLYGLNPFQTGKILTDKLDLANYLKICKKQQLK